MHENNDDVFVIALYTSMAWLAVLALFFFAAMSGEMR